MAKTKASSAKVALNLSRLTISQKISLARTISQAMAGNASFPAPPVAPADVAKAADALDKSEGDAKAARQAALLKTSQRDDAATALEGLLAQLEAYVQMQGKGDAALIASSGMPLRGATVKTTSAPAAPGNLVADSGAKAGEAKLKWAKPAGARSYVVERTANPNDATSWAHIGATTKTRFVAAGQPAGRAWFRVAGVGAQGQGAWSDPATCIVP